ncbi:Uncharacterised protein [Mycobacteroides abscessus subsp. abscessus]|nr:Uncharacterised protein [Mycobacteroides abscessus subsp. abscessus]
MSGSCVSRSPIRRTRAPWCATGCGISPTISGCFSVCQAAATFSVPPTTFGATGTGTIPPRKHPQIAATKSSLRDR